MTENPSNHRNFNYPPSRQGNVVDDYHGTLVADPYRWLEDPDSAETIAWVDAQNALTRSYLDEIPALSTIRRRLTQLWDYPKYTAPQRSGRRYFFTLNDGLQGQPVLYWQESLDAEPAVLLDPNTLSEDGTAAITNHAFSKDGRHLAYGISRSGSDQQQLHVREVDSGRDYDDFLDYCRFANIAWKHDGSGFFYNRNPEPGSVPDEDLYKHSKLYWHQLGTPQSEDILIYERPDAPELSFPPTITEDGRYLVCHVWHAAIDRNRLYYRLVDEEGELLRLIDEPDAMYRLVGSDGDTFYLHTDRDAPNGRIIAVDLANPEPDQWRTLIPDGPDPIHFALMAGGKFVVVTMQNAHHKVRLYETDGRPAGDIPLPAIGSIVEIHGRRAHDELFLDFESYLVPRTPYRYDFDAGTLTPLRKTDLSFDPAGYETRQVFFESTGGARVSIFLTHKKGLALDGNNPTLLYGYGGFNVSLTPSFRVANLHWLEQGGVYAVANLRGGSEYGEAWHEAGMLGDKQNVFDDFIGAAEHVIASGYTSSERLAIMGGSNGGLLVSACMLQRPELFGAVICSVPVTDMLRYHKFTAGRYWTAEYGNAEDPEHFPFLFAYSPLHNVQPGVAYPPLLITTADTDDRVVPMHAKKFAATMQAADSGHHPILIRIETKAGHGLGKPTGKVIEESSDIYAFLWATIGRS